MVSVALLNTGGASVPAHGLLCRDYGLGSVSAVRPSCLWVRPDGITAEGCRRPVRQRERSEGRLSADAGRPATRAMQRPGESSQDRTRQSLRLHAEGYARRCRGESPRRRMVR